MMMARVPFSLFILVMYAFERKVPESVDIPVIRVKFVLFRFVSEMVFSCKLQDLKLFEISAHTSSGLMFSSRTRLSRKPSMVIFIKKSFSIPPG